jgi:cyclophilin family peptidyl-prolyl cis-trans isomerase
MPELPPPADPGTRYTAVMDTSAGEITLELWPDLAPQTVGNAVGPSSHCYFAVMFLPGIIDAFFIVSALPNR